jgi:thiosulfate/3-mercaptopyruvate sulfurtransferase
MKKLLNVLFVSIIALNLSAQLVTVDQVAKIIKQPEVIVIDARPSADYLKTHVDGAINIPVTDLCNTTPVEGTLKSSSQLATVLGQKGITRTSKIVVYCKTGVNAGRMYWILKHMGCTDVSMMDGQMQGWFDARKPITKTPKTLKAATFTPAVNAKINVDKAYVKTKVSASGTVLVDSREKKDYDAGHIGNAVNIPHESMLSGTKLKSVAALTTLFTNAGVTKDKEVILYCKTSTTAGLTYFVLTSLLNYPNVKVYDGAYLDWSK